MEARARVKAIKCPHMAFSPTCNRCIEQAILAAESAARDEQKEKDAKVCLELIDIEDLEEARILRACAAAIRAGESK